MSELKLTIDQLKNYLGTGLEIVYGGKSQFKSFLGRSGVQGNIDIHSAIDLESKPIVYRLSDLDKEIEVNGERFVPLDKLNELFGYEECRLVHYSNSGLGWSIDPGFANTAISWEDMYPIIKKIFDWHFWPFGDEYFDQGLVIEKMTVK